MEWHCNSLKQKEADFVPAVPSWLRPLPPPVEKFAPLLAEIGKYYSRKKLQNSTVLELGPGKRVQLAQLLRSRIPSLQLRCVGTPGLPITPGYYIKEDINNYLRSLTNRSIVLVYSRFVLEKYSINPLALLFSNSFLKLLCPVSRSKLQVLDQVPGTYEYLLQTYQLLGKKVKNGGRIIAMVVDRQQSVDLCEDKITEFFKAETCLAIGPDMGLFTLKRTQNGQIMGN